MTVLKFQPWKCIVIRIQKVVGLEHANELITSNGRDSADAFCVGLNSSGFIIPQSRQSSELGPLPPSPASAPLFRGGGTLACGREGGGPNSDERTDTVVLKVYTDMYRCFVYRTVTDPEFSKFPQNELLTFCMEILQPRQHGILGPGHPRHHAATE